MTPNGSQSYLASQDSFASTGPISTNVMKIQHEKLKEISRRLDIPMTNLIRKGISWILNEYEAAMETNEDLLCIPNITKRLEKADKDMIEGKATKWDGNF